MANFNTKLFKSLNESEYKELYTPKRTLNEATTDVNEVSEEYKKAYHIDLDLNKVPCVIARDKFLSGWGGAEGKTHYQVVLCGDSTEAANIEANMRSLGKEEGLANIRRDFGVHLSSRVSASYVVGRYAAAWNNLSDSWYENRFDSGKTEDEINQEKDAQEERRQEKLRQREQQTNESEELDEWKDGGSTNQYAITFYANSNLPEEDLETKTQEVVSVLEDDEMIERPIKDIKVQKISEINTRLPENSLKEEYSEKLGGDPEDFISDVELILNKLKEIDVSTLGTHLAKEIIDQFIETCDSQISMAKSRFLGESDLGIDLSPDEEQIYDDIINRNYDDIYNNLDNEEKEEYQKVASTIRTLKPDEAFIDIEKEVREKAKENHLEADILTYVYLSKYNKKSLGESEENDISDEEFKKKYSKSFNTWKKENPEKSDKEIVDILKAKQYNGELKEDESDIHKMKDCTDDVEVIMALEGDTLELDDMEDWNRLKELAKSLSRSQGFYERLLASMEETEEGDLEFPIFL